MPLPVDQAMDHVNRRIPDNLRRKYRNYAISDFLPYRSWLSTAPLAECQKSWALFLKWNLLCNANRSKWGAGQAGKDFGSGDPSTRFCYDHGANHTQAPTIAANGAHQATLQGVGQCGYFAVDAFKRLKLGGRRHPVPRVDRVATPGHNWVLVNYNPNRPNDTSSWIIVDVWLMALGLPVDETICEHADVVSSNANLQPIYTPANITIKETYDPNNLNNLNNPVNAPAPGSIAARRAMFERT